MLPARNSTVRTCLVFSSRSIFVDLQGKLISSCWKSCFRCLPIHNKSCLQRCSYSPLLNLKYVIRSSLFFIKKKQNTQIKTRFSHVENHGFGIWKPVMHIFESLTLENAIRLMKFRNSVSQNIKKKCFRFWKTSSPWIKKGPQVENERVRRGPLDRCLMGVRLGNGFASCRACIRARSLVVSWESFQLTTKLPRAFPFPFVLWSLSLFPCGMTMTSSEC
jgi:hypothetical protein